MYKNKRVSVYFPCRNEAAHLKEVVNRVPAFVDEIIIVSNKSTDNTLAVARKLGPKVKALADNRTIGSIGYGFAHMTGIKKASGDIIVAADGDATYPVEELAKIIDHLLAGKLDFVACNRYPVQAGTKIPYKLRFGVRLLNLEVRLLYGKKIQDILSGMWVFRGDIKDRLNLTMGDWNLSPEIKLRAATSPTIAFGEYSISQHSRMGSSHQKYFKTGLSHLGWIAKNRFQNFFRWEALGAQLNNLGGGPVETLEAEPVETDA